MLDNDHRLLAGGLIHLLLHRHPFDDVVELHATGLFRQDGNIVRVPLHEGLAFLHLAAVGTGNDRADHDIVRFEFAAIFGQNGNRSIFVQHDVVAVLQLDEAQIVVANRAVKLCLDLRLLEHLGSGAADVKGAHG